MGLVRILREDGYTFLRGCEPRSALLRQGLSTAPRAWSTSIWATIRAS